MTAAIRCRIALVAALTPEFDTFLEFSVEILTEGVLKQWDS